MKCGIFVAILGCIVMSAISEQLLCYYRFIPILNSIAIEAEKGSVICCNQTKILREETLAKLVDDKLDILHRIKEITESFKTCENIKDTVKCAECVSTAVYEVRNTLQLMESKSIDIVNYYRNNVGNIDQECHRTAVDQASSKSTSAFRSLTSCLLFGIDMPTNADNLN